LLGLLIGGEPAFPIARPLSVQKLLGNDTNISSLSPFVEGSLDALDQPLVNASFKWDSSSLLLKSVNSSSCLRQFFRHLFFIATTSLTLREQGEH
jgi:hypothetical protein